MKALLSLAVLFASAGAFAQTQIPAESSHDFGAWTTFYYPRATGLPIRNKSTDNDGVCALKHKLFGAGERKSVKTETVRVPAVSEVNSKGEVSPGPAISQNSRNGKYDKVEIIAAIPCYNYKQVKVKH